MQALVHAHTHTLDVRLTLGHVDLFGEFYHLIETGWNHLLGLFQYINQLPGLLGIAAGEETVRCACLLCTSRTSNTMNVVLSVVGKIEIHYMFDIVYVCGRRQDNTLCMRSCCVRVHRRGGKIHQVSYMY